MQFHDPKAWSCVFFFLGRTQYTLSDFVTTTDGALQFHEVAGPTQVQLQQWFLEVCSHPRPYHKGYSLPIKSCEILKCLEKYCQIL